MGKKTINEKRGFFLLVRNTELSLIFLPEKLCSLLKEGFRSPLPFRSGWFRSSWVDVKWASHLSSRDSERIKESDHDHASSKSWRQRQKQTIALTKVSRGGPEDWVPDVFRNWTAGSRNEFSLKVVLNGSEIGMLQFQTLFVPNAGWDD